MTSENEEGLPLREIVESIILIPDNSNNLEQNELKTIVCLIKLAIFCVFRVKLIHF